jgi:hypothetical protein
MGNSLTVAAQMGLRRGLMEMVGDPMVIVCSKPIPITAGPVTEPQK